MEHVDQQVQFLTSKNLNLLHIFPLQGIVLVYGLFLVSHDNNGL